MTDTTESNARDLLERADVLELQFERLGTVECIHESIECRSQALSLTPEGHRGRPHRLAVLATSLRCRFECLGELVDINMAIEYHMQAVLLTPEGHVDKPKRLVELGNSFASRFNRLGELADVEQAVELQTKAMLLTPDGHVDRPSLLNNLGNSYHSRFERLGESADLDKAIEYHTQAVQLTPNGHPDKPSQLNNLGNSYHSRFERRGELSDLDMAVEHLAQAVQLTLDSHLGKAGLLNNLGNAYHSRFERLGALADIDKAIELRNQAVLLTPDGHPDKANLLNNLGNSYHSQFERLGTLADMDKAIELRSQAVQLTPDGHPGKASLLNNLGNSYQSRFVHLDELKDLDMAVEYLTQAVQLTPDGHPGKAGLFNNLGNSYQSRFRRLDEPEDVNKAIEYQTQAVLLTPDGHPDKAASLNNLGNSYHSRFQRLGQLADLDMAIESVSRAVQLTTDGHPGQANQLNNLGNSYKSRFQRVGELADLEHARSLFQRAAQTITVSPSMQIRCARGWAECSTLLGLSPLQAYERCMQLIPHLVWIGMTIDQRYNVLPTISDMTAEAAAWAISVQSYDLAIEWLEQGRSIVWSQVLQLRSPFDYLAAVTPPFAQRLSAIGSELESAGFRRAAETPSTTAVSGTERDARNHRRLAAEWEQLIQMARSTPGFDNFMRPRKASDLKLAATDGPVVLINTHSTRCDALLLFPECDEVAHIPLENFSLDKVVVARRQLDSSAGNEGDRDGGFKRSHSTASHENLFKPMLATLWSDVVNPILGFLACTHVLPVDELPHVTWCATGALSFLPLHAAGLYDGTQPNTFDLVVSSYTPTLSALLAPGALASNPNIGLLAVGQEHTPGCTPLPSTVQELALIKDHLGETRFQQLDGVSATVDAVLRAMEEFSCVHLACHVTPDPARAMNSSFRLHNGNLTLEAIAKRTFQNKSLAFLSASYTATGDDNLPDEAIHLAAGMLVAGYPSVIATLLSIDDKDAPEVAGQVYAELMQDGSLSARGAARALHKAVSGLRVKVGNDEFRRWVPFIHLGK